MTVLGNGSFLNKSGLREMTAALLAPQTQKDGKGGASNVASGSSWGPSGEASGVPGPSFWSLFDSRNRPGDENSEMLENDDPYSTLAMFLRSQEPRNEVKMRQKRLRGQSNDVGSCRKRSEGVFGAVQGDQGGPWRLQDGVLEAPRALEYADPAGDGEMRGACLLIKSI